MTSFIFTLKLLSKFEFISQPHFETISILTFIDFNMLGSVYPGVGHFRLSIATKAVLWLTLVDA